MAGPTLASPDDLDSAVLGAFIQSQTLAGLVFHFSCLSALDFKKKKKSLSTWLSLSGGAVVPSSAKNKQIN